MPSKDPVNKQQGDEARPYTVFYVSPETPEEVHTDTVMAHNCEDATAIAGAKYGIDYVLHIRGIGVTEYDVQPDKVAEMPKAEKGNFPCARFINGKFLSATFSDDPWLEDLSEQN